MHDIVRRCLTDITAAGEESWLFIQRGFDATPIKVSFGKLTGLMAPAARYFLRRKGSTKWEKLSFQQMRDRGIKPKFGTAEMPGQMCTVAYPRDVRSVAHAYKVEKIHSGRWFLTARTRLLSSLP